MQWNGKPGYGDFAKLKICHHAQQLSPIRARSRSLPLGHIDIFTSATAQDLLQ